MKTSLRWLNTMVNVPTDLASFTETLDLTGTGVDAILHTGATLDGVVVGQILTKTQLPESDHLWLTTVDVGERNVDENGEPQSLQIVCGAQNFNTGDKIPVALIGTTLPNGLTIKRSKLRGFESFGMNCSRAELGLGEDHDGIMILPSDAPVGAAFAEYMQLGDTVLDLELTPNRPDCMSMLGMAREVAAVYATEYRLPEVSELLAENEPAGQARGLEGSDSRERTTVLPAALDAASTPAAASAASAATAAATTTPSTIATPSIAVNIVEAERSARYTAQLITGVKVGPSPQWLVDRLVAAGARPINNIVDVTNYIMFELGQPLHAFDYDCLTKDADGQVSITVRAATQGERFTTLDGVERELDPDVTCIVDANANSGAGQTIALAGVMGGLTSEVSESTVNVLLESAAFSTAHTSRTSRRLKLVSESSMRFERGVDDARCAEFSMRAAQLMVAIAGGQITGEIVDSYPAPRELPLIDFRVDRFWALTTAELNTDEIVDILIRLGCNVDIMPSLVEPLMLKVTPPSFRPDLLREIDLFEEVLRVWGMNNVKPTLPGGRERIGQLTEAQQKERKGSWLLRAMGINETMTYAFVPPSDEEKLPFNYGENEQAVELINPMSAEMSVMRRSILPGLLRAIAYNLNHGTSDVQLYEIGNVFFIAEGRKLPREHQMLCAVMVGAAGQSTWNRVQPNVDFYDAKGVIETIGSELNVAKLRFKELDVDKTPWLQAGRAASILADSSQLGWIGEVHPRVAQEFDINVPVIAFELDLELLIKASQSSAEYAEIAMYPSVSRDLAVVVTRDVTAEKVTQVLQSAGGKLLSDIRIFDVFEDEKRLGANKKSLAFSLVYRAPDRTLTSEEVDSQHQKLVDKVQKVLGAEIRA